MFKWFSSEATSPSSPSSSSSSSSSSPPSPQSSGGCPVDHKDRGSLNSQNFMYPASELQEPVPTKDNSSNASCSSSTSPSSTSNSTSSSSLLLSQDRVVSSIPRSESSENWTYPSETMFFNAMKRKGHDPDARDMKTVVTMHNVVNERSWVELKRWEKEFHFDCDNIKLKRFQGKPDDPSPKAYIKHLMGYEKPFDRHDWTIDRCGQEVTYVIDFYRGKSTSDDSSSSQSSSQSSPVSIYLDVRPALNTWENAWDRIKKSVSSLSLR